MEITLNAFIGQPFHIELITMLERVGRGPLEWKVSKDLPAWLSLDADTGRLTGLASPKDEGTLTFRVTVGDADANADEYDLTLRVKRELTLAG